MTDPTPILIIMQSRPEPEDARSMPMDNPTFGPYEVEARQLGALGIVALDAARGSSSWWRGA